MEALMTPVLSEPVLDGPVDSIRWEMLRDGIEDYEYLTILKKLIEKNNSRLTPAQQKHFTSLLEVPADITKTMTEFTKHPDPIEKQRHKIATAITQLINLR